MGVLKLHGTGRKVTGHGVNGIHVQDRGFGDPHEITGQKLLQLIQLIFGPVYIVDSMYTDIPFLRFKEQHILKGQIVFRIFMLHPHSQSIFDYKLIITEKNGLPIAFAYVVWFWRVSGKNFYVKKHFQIFP